jgi:hypothetical protein
MKSNIIVSLTAFLVFSCGALYAHHSFTATYDQTKTITIEGKVAQFVLRNPHSFLHVLAKDESGQMQRWSVEWQSSAQIAGAGITKDTLKPGDSVVVTGNPGRDAADHRIRMMKIKRTSDGFIWGNLPGQVVD